MKYILLFFFSTFVLFQTAVGYAQNAPSNASRIQGVAAMASQGFPFDPFQSPSLFFIDDAQQKYALDGKAFQTFEPHITRGTLRRIVQNSFQSSEAPPIKDVLWAKDATQFTFVVVNDTAHKRWVIDLSSSRFLPRPSYESISVYNAITGSQIAVLQKTQEKQTITLENGKPYIFTVSLAGASNNWGAYSPSLYAYGSRHDTNMSIGLLALILLSGGVFVIVTLLLFSSPPSISIPSFVGYGIFFVGLISNTLRIETIGSLVPILFVAWLPFILLAQYTLFKKRQAPDIVKKGNLVGIFLSLCMLAACLVPMPSHIAIPAVTILFIVTALCNCALYFLLSISDVARGFFSSFLGWVLLTVGALLTGLSLLGVIPDALVIINAYYMLVPAFGALWCLSILNSQAPEAVQQATQKKDNRKVEQLNQTLQKTREGLDSARLMQVLKREREIMKDLREKDIQLTEEMKKEKEKADYANQAKSAFLAVISHEIRTPMTGIMGMVRLLRHSGLEDEQNSHVDTISDSGDAMMALLNDILDYEKIDTGKMEIESIEFDLYNLLQNVQSLMVGRTDEKNIALKLEVSEGTPQYICGDPTRLRQIFLNLVSNAIKFTEEGHVSLQVKRLEYKDGEYTLYFAIQDTGIGIPKEAQENLFNPFSQADSSTSRKYGGSGLGLAICQKLVKAMGGSISINSAPGDGSNFFFSVKLPAGKDNDTDIMLPPVLCAAAQHNKKPEAKPEQNISQATPKVVSPEPIEKEENITPTSSSEVDSNTLQIMVVDDNLINQKVVAGLVAPLGHTVTSFNSGNAAIDELKQNQQQYDIVLMDIEMPGISGVETTRIIRQELEILKDDLPIVALTGNTDENEITSYLAVGMNSFLAKPIEMDKMEATLSSCPIRRKVLETNNSESTKTVMPDTPSVVAEPEEIDFSRTPAPKVEKISPEVEIIDPPVHLPVTQDIQDTKVDLELDHAETVYAREIPSTDEDDARRNPELSDMNTGLSIDDSVEKQEQKTEEEASYNPADFDATTIMSLKTSMDGGELREMIVDLLDKLHEINMQVAAAVEENKTDLVRARAHDLKGMAGNFGLVGVNSRATLIEDAIKSGGTAEKELKRLRDQLDADVKQAQLFLEKWIA